MSGQPLQPELAVLFEDPHLLVLNKPAPLLTQAPEGIPNLEAFAKVYIKAKYAKPGGVYLGVPHRLDRPVSGVVVFARNTKAAQRLQLQFESRTVAKTYWAWVEGTGIPDEGTWENWLRKVPDEPRAEEVALGSAGAKLARLSYRVLNVRNGFTQLELKPQTGRMHQLRIQCSLRGHPVVGDTLYGSSVPFGPTTDDPKEKVIALHARELSLEHPFRKDRLTFTAPPPESWSKFGDA